MAGMTLTEKILARASNEDVVQAGEIIDATVDWCMTNDATTHISIDIFQKLVKEKRLFNPDKTIFVIDHNVPSESIKTTQVQNKMRHFARTHGVHLHDGEGVCHQLLLEQYVLPGQVVIGADSHTCTMGSVGAFGAGVGSTDFVATMVTGKIWLMVPKTLKFNLYNSFRDGVYARDLVLKIIGDITSSGATYMAMEFGEPVSRDLSVDDRITLCNMGVEAGAKNAIIEADEKTLQFLESCRGNVDGYKIYKSDPDCIYHKVYEYDLSQVEPAIAMPHEVDKYNLVKNLEGMEINQGFIGSCNNGRIESLRIAARILKNKKVHPKVKLIISPASRSVYFQALQEGLIEVFLTSGAMVVNPNCSVCFGSCQGVLGKGDVLLSTGTRNFKGRAGSPDSFVYLASAATVAASSITGKVIDPRNDL